MIPIVTPAQMSAIDAAAPEPTEVLIERAGAAVARAAIQMMGGRYGRRVVVLVGSHNNGADGRAASRRLQRVGVRVSVVSVADAPPTLPAADLYVDAAFGTGLSRPFTPPARSCSRAPVLAVDIPSGLDGLTGEVHGGPVWPARRTVTFAALKPGLLFGLGPSVCGEVTVADIGIDVGAPAAGQCGLVCDSDVEPLPVGTGSTHKWQAGVLVVAGSSGMGGAAALTCAAALRSGARLVHLSAPARVQAEAPVEVVCSEPPLQVDPRRFRVVVVGPGLGSDAEAQARSAEALASGLPAVVDADGLRLLGEPAVAAVLSQRRERHRHMLLVLTPHDAELEALVGHRPGVDRIAAARAVAVELGVVVLLKGGPSVVADPDGCVRVVSSGDPRLATAGTGDVLAGMIAGRLAAFGTQRVSDAVVASGSERVPDSVSEFGGKCLLDRVAEAAYLHGRAAKAVGGGRIVASDLVAALRDTTP